MTDDLERRLRDLFDQKLSYCRRDYTAALAKACLEYRGLYLYQMRNYKVPYSDEIDAGLLEALKIDQ